MLQIISVSLVCAVIVVYLKNINNELAILSSIMSGIIILNMVFSYLGGAVSFFNKIIDIAGLDSDLYKIIFKITAIGYIVEFSAGTLEDFGLKNLSNKLIFAGKVIILSTSLPIIYAIFEVFTKLF